MVAKHINKSRQAKAKCLPSNVSLFGQGFNEQTALSGKHLIFSGHGMFIRLATHDKHSRQTLIFPLQSFSIALLFPPNYYKNNRSNVFQRMFSKWPNTQILANIAFKTNRFCLSMFLKLLENIFACDKQKMFAKHMFVKWPN